MNWPAAVLIIAFGFLILFYKAIVRLLDRTHKIGPQGLEAESAAAQGKSALEQRPKNISSQADELLRLFDNKLLQDAETFIRSDLEKRGVTDTAEREQRLIRLFAVAGIAALFERTYNLIFGSQLRVLQALNAQPLEKLQVEQYYAEAKAAYPHMYLQYSFDQWFQFMLSELLITIVNGSTVGITVRGREFLKYLIQEGFSLLKAG